MSKLDRCKHCGGEAIIFKVPGAKAKTDKKTGVVRPALAVQCTNTDCGVSIGNFYKKSDLFTAWNRQPPAHKYTLEELREMDMQVVWVSDLLIPACSDYHLVVRINEETRLYSREACEQKHVGYNATSGHNYDKTWSAYDREPKEETDAND